MLSAIAPAVRTPDLRRKILFTLGLIALYRLGAVLPSPGVDYKSVHTCIGIVSGGESAGIYQLIDLVSGGAMLQLSVFAIGIMPFITASIITQLLTIVIPRFEELRSEGQSGQAKITQYTRYVAMALAVLQATTLVALASRGQLLRGCQKDILDDTSIFGMIIIVL
ncbi:preprotein translocase subunit SecY, partial [Nocardia sp. NPDC004711]